MIAATSHILRRSWARGGAGRGAARGAGRRVGRGAGRGARGGAWGVGHRARATAMVGSGPLYVCGMEFPEGLAEQAAQNPGGWVYEISQKYVTDPDGYVPPEA